MAKEGEIWFEPAPIYLMLDTRGHLIEDAQADAVLAGGAETALLASFANTDATQVQHGRRRLHRSHQRNG